MKHFLWIFLLLPSALPSSAQSLTLNQGGISATNYYEELPYETLNGKLFVYVELAGKKYKFLFDTGAPVMVSKELADILAAPVLHKEMLTDAYGGKDSTLIVRIDSIRVGKLVFNGIPAIDGTPGFYKCWNVEGVLGSNIFRNSIVCIDPARHLIVVTDQLDRLPLKDKKGIPLITDIGEQSDPKIKIRFGKNVDAVFGFDTGDAEFLRIPEEYMNRFKEAGLCDIVWKGYGSHEFGMTGASRAADKYLLKFPALTVCNSSFKNALVETDKQASAAIGARLLDYGSVTLDFLHKKFYFNAIDSARATDPANATPARAIDVYEKQWPFQPSIDGDQLVIGVVWDNAFSKEIRPGEQIMAVNDIDVGHIDFCDILTKKPLLAGKDQAIITIKDELGNIKKLQISKQ
jgi:hypothetical protein